MQTTTSVQINYSDLLTCRVDTRPTAAIYDTENHCNSLLLIWALDENYQVLRDSPEHLFEYRL